MKNKKSKKEAYRYYTKKGFFIGIFFAIVFLIYFIINIIIGLPSIYSKSNYGILWFLIVLIPMIIFAIFISAIIIGFSTLIGFIIDGKIKK